MEMDAVLRIIADERDHFQLEIEQGVMQHDLYKSTAALGGKDACDRILRALAFHSRSDVGPQGVQKRRA